MLPGSDNSDSRSALSQSVVSGERVKFLLSCILSVLPPISRCCSSVWEPVIPAAANAAGGASSRVSRGAAAPSVEDKSRDRSVEIPPPPPPASRQPCTDDWLIMASRLSLTISLLHKIVSLVWSVVVVLDVVLAVLCSAPLVPLPRSASLSSSPRNASWSNSLRRVS